MTADLSTRTASSIPSIVHRLDPLVQAALRAGLPMGPNVLLTVRRRRPCRISAVPAARRLWTHATSPNGENRYSASPSRPIATGTVRGTLRTTGDMLKAMR